MEKRYNCNPNELRQSRITFWFYVGSIPIIIFLFLLPYMQQGKFVFGPFSFVYIVIILFLLYSGYRAFRVMKSTQNSHCIVTDTRVSGVSTPNPYKTAIPFDIEKTDILGIGKTTVSVGGMRAYNALVINTKDQKIVLLAIDSPDELKQDLS